LKADPSDGSDEEGGRDFKSHLNPNSLEILRHCRLEPSLAAAKPGNRYQFERQGYFSVDPSSSEGDLVFNRTVTLRDEWAKIMKEQKGE
jgi:glutaminyl-tRNA synthetase